MADKDWIKSFPRGYRAYAIQIEEGNYQTATLELETKVLRSIRKDCHDVIGFLVNIGNYVQNHSANRFTVSEIDNLFDQKLKEKEVVCIKPMIKLAKDSCLAKLKSISKNPNLPQEIVGHFVGSYINKEVTDKFHNVTPKDPEYSNIVNKVKKEMISPQIKKLQGQVAQKVTLQLLNQSRSDQEIANKEAGRFNFFDSNRLRGDGYAT